MKQLHLSLAIERDRHCGINTEPRCARDKRSTGRVHCGECRLTGTKVSRHSLRLFQDFRTQTQFDLLFAWFLLKVHFEEQKFDLHQMYLRVFLPKTTIHSGRLRSVVGS